MHAVYTDGAHAGSCGSGSDTDGSMAYDALQASGPWPPCRGVLGYICRAATAMWRERRCMTRFPPPLFSTGSRPASVASATGKRAFRRRRLHGNRPDQLGDRRGRRPYIAPHRRLQLICPALLRTDRFGLIQPMESPVTAVQPPLSDLHPRSPASTASTMAPSTNSRVPLCILRAGSARNSVWHPCTTGRPTFFTILCDQKFEQCELSWYVHHEMVLRDEDRVPVCKVVCRIVCCNGSC